MSAGKVGACRPPRGRKATRPNKYDDGISWPEFKRMVDSAHRKFFARRGIDVKSLARDYIGASFTGNGLKGGNS